MKPEKIYIGIDASGSRGFQMVSGSEFFTIAAVTTTNIDYAMNATNEIEQKWGNKKGKNLHGEWEAVVDIINKYPFRYYLFFLNRTSINPEFSKYFRVLKFEQSSYSPIVKKYSMHGWLIVDILKNSGYRGNLEIRVDKDLNGTDWDQYLKEVKGYADTIGNCDLTRSDDTYPLIRIADIVANFTYWHMKRKIMSGDDYAISKKLGRNTIYMVLKLDPLQNGFNMQMIPYGMVDINGAFSFKPW